MTQGQADRMRKGMVRSTIRMLIPLNKQSEALEILEMVRVQTQFEPNCISTRLYRGVDEVRAIMVEELWTSEEYLLHHLRSEEYRRVLLVFEMAEVHPEIQFDTINSSTGLETIEKARTRP